jgi:hypothetical protein
MANGSEFELLLYGDLNGFGRSLIFNKTDRVFRADVAGEILTTNALLNLVAANQSFILMPVVAGTSTRLGLDRDLDGFFDTEEMIAGFDPGDPSSLPFEVVVERTSDASQLRFTWPSVRGELYQLQRSTTLTNQAGWSSLHESRATAASMSHIEPLSSDAARHYFRVVRVKTD